jgi:hypothetical protein
VVISVIVRSALLDISASFLILPPAQPNASKLECRMNQ